MKKEIKPEDMIIEFIKSKVKNVQLQFPFVVDLPEEKYSQSKEEIICEFEEFVANRIVDTKKPHLD
jgi:hypothetical protein